jgi:hypothetical protein
LEDEEGTAAPLRWPAVRRVRSRLVVQSRTLAALAR